jgi:hypothetical protein
MHEIIPPRYDQMTEKDLAIYLASLEKAKIKFVSNKEAREELSKMGDKALTGASKKTIMAYYSNQIIK